ncbi:MULTISPECIES: hypothetical protein [Lacrimispora]|uniref:hypothetical protein n=1 Tax=Lacrimispora TaxID=2719231 RepID=UPI001409AE14|nr:hypothetical protein [Lacrimispora amygdalina]
MITTVPGNPDYTYGKDYESLPPYISYGDRSIRESSLEPSDIIAKDLEYLQGMYPGHMKRLHEYVVSACDHLDYKDSPMYDEYPDRLLIHQVCDSICAKIREEGIITDELLMGNEDSMESAAQMQTEPMEWENEEVEKAELNDRYSTWGPPGWGPPGPKPPGWRPPPWGPGPRPPYWGPGRRPPYWGPGPKPPYWGPGPGPKPPYWGPGPGPKPPYWGKGPRPSQGNGWLGDIVSVLLLNEMHRRRCNSGRCR